MGMNSLNASPRTQYFRLGFHPALNRVVLRIIAMLCAIALIASAGAGSFFTGAPDTGRYLWKSVSRAQCKLDDKVPLAWNIYQTEKKKEANLVLVLLGRRYLALDFKAKIVYYVLPTELQAKGPDFESGDLFVRSRVMPTKDWAVRDVGPAEMIRVTLGDYGHRLDVELPHMPDLRAFY
jgi:hypothetical protein